MRRIRNGVSTPPPPVPVTRIAGTCRNVLPERCDCVRLNVFQWKRLLLLSTVVVHFASNTFVRPSTGRDVEFCGRKELAAHALTALTFPITSCVAESLFRAMKGLLTPDRRFMAEDTQNGVFVCNVQW